MPISKKQIKANRQNAKKSTGPKTEEGKKVSSQNGTTHGLNAVNIIINSPHLKENQKEYEILVAALMDELQPRSQLQTHQVYKIANCHWRYRRLINAETALINRQTDPEGFALETSEYWRDKLKAKGLLENFLTSGLIPRGTEANLLSRYEWRLSRELHHSYKLLRQLQAEESKGDNKKSQTEPISPKPLTPQEDTATFYPPYRPENGEFVDTSHNHRNNSNSKDEKIVFSPLPSGLVPSEVEVDGLGEESLVAGSKVLLTSPSPTRPDISSVPG